MKDKHMKNDIPKNRADILIAASSVANGATLHGDAIQLKPGTAVAINDAASLAQKSLEDLEKGRVDLRQNFAALALVILQVRAFARLLREFMRTVFGPKHSD